MNLGEFAEEATIIEETAISNKSLHFIEANTQEVYERSGADAGAGG